jgi:hypothetical protein
MRRLLAGVCAFGMVLAAGAASATVVKGTFSAVITSGTADHQFGFDSADLTNLPLKGTFTYDTSILGPDQELFPGFGRFESSAGGLTIKETVNHHTVVFPGAPSSVPGLQFNTAHSGMVVQTLTGQNLEFMTHASIGDAGTFFRETHTLLSLQLPAGVISDPDASPALTYSGPVSDFFQSYLLPPFTTNNGSLITDDVAAVVHTTTYSFDVTSLSMAVPEPRAWLMMAAGVTALAGRLRSRRRAVATA